VIVSGLVSTIAGTVGVFGSADGVGSNARFTGMFAIVYDGQGNLFISDTYDKTIRKLVISSGLVSTIAGGSYGSDDGIGSVVQFTSPEGIAYDGNGNLYITDKYNHTIRKLVIATGQVTTIAGVTGSGGIVDGIGSAARFYYPQGITCDGNGNLYICDLIAIRKLMIATGEVTTISMGFYSPEGIAYDGNGNLYISQWFYNHSISKLVIATQEVTTIAGVAGSPGSDDGVGSAARFYAPRGLTCDGNGNLYICDASNYTIRKIIL
jgi:streptogramin lyase